MITHQNIQLLINNVHTNFIQVTTNTQYIKNSHAQMIHRNIQPLISDLSGNCTWTSNSLWILEMLALRLPMILEWCFELTFNTNVKLCNSHQQQLTLY